MLTVVSTPLPLPATAWRRAPPAPWPRERFGSRLVLLVTVRRRKSAAKPPRPAQHSSVVQEREVLDALLPPNQRSVFAVTMAPATAQATAGDARSGAHELLALIGSHEAAEHLIDLVPRLQLLHIAEPALDVGVSGEIAIDQFADRHDGGAEIVGDRQLVAAQILIFRPDPMVVENLQPVFGALLSPGHGAGMGLVATALVVRKQLRVDQPVTEVAIELGVDPVHHLIDLGALLQILRIGWQVVFVGEIFQNCRTFRQAEITIL